MTHLKRLIYLSAAVSLASALGVTAQDAPPEKPKGPAPKHAGWSSSALHAPREKPKKTLSAEGGVGTLKTVKSALVWLRKHQHPDGHWSAAAHTDMCRNASKRCAVESEVYAGFQPGWSHYDPGVTSLALLAFLAGGDTHLKARESANRKVIGGAMRWLLEQQVREEGQDEGFIGRTRVESQVYNHAFATAALAELLLGSGDREALQKPVERAVKYCLRSQNPEYGWRYDSRDGTNTPVTCAMTMALISAAACAEAGLLDLDGYELDERLSWASNWFRRATSAKGVTGYLSPGDPGSQLTDVHPPPYPFSKAMRTNTASALFCQQIMRNRPPTYDEGIELVRQHPPAWRPREGKRKSTINFYYWYYATHALFQHGGTEWKVWNRTLRKTLAENQRRSGCAKGSWDPLGEWGIVGGRVYSTALAALTLQVYHRYARME